MWNKVDQLCPTLQLQGLYGGGGLVAKSVSDSCDSMDREAWQATAHGILQTRILEWVAFPSSKGSFQPSDRTQVSHIAGGFLTGWATREAYF